MLIMGIVNCKMVRTLMSPQRGAEIYSQRSQAFVDNLNSRQPLQRPYFPTDYEINASIKNDCATLCTSKVGKFIGFAFSKNCVHHQKLWCNQKDSD